jgi:hypothetical protein
VIERPELRLSAWQQRLALPCVLAAAVLTGCSTPQTGVVRLGDGVMKAATVQEAETFCRTSGDPTRIVRQSKDEPGVLFRCD